MEGTSGHHITSLDSSADEHDSKSNNSNRGPKTDNAGAPRGPGRRIPKANKASAQLRAPGEGLADIAPREPIEISLRKLLEAGVHFGHQTARWNPAMAKFIYGTRNGIHVINLPHTIECWEKARKAIVEIASRGGSVLFVGTKKQAQDPVVEEARRAGAFYVSRRWLGGMMTNFQTIRRSIERMNKLETTLQEEEEAQRQGTATRFTKKERLMMSRERDKLYYSLGGIRDMYSPPQLLFVIDTKREDIAIKEAKRLDIPVVALVDTNCDPAGVNFPIPSNDDGTRAIRLFCAAVADAVAEGRSNFSKRSGKDSDNISSSRKYPESRHAEFRPTQAVRDSQAAPREEVALESASPNKEEPAAEVLSDAEEGKA